MIYRTAYGPGSDADVTLALEKIKQHLTHDVFFEVPLAAETGTTLDATPNQQIVDTYRPEIRQGPEFDGASDATIRAHFEASVQEVERNQDTDANAFIRFVDGAYMAACIILDEESLQSLINGPDPVPFDSYSEIVKAGEFKMLDRGCISVRVVCDELWLLYNYLMQDIELAEYTRFDKDLNMVVFDIEADLYDQRQLLKGVYGALALQ